MRIKDIKYETGLIFKKEELVVISDQGKGRIKLKENKSTIKQLNSKLKKFEVNSLNDLQKIDEIVKETDEELLPYISITVLNSSKYPWTMINKNAKQIPRPIASIFKKNKGIKEFFILSLDANNFQSVIKSAIEIKGILNKKLTEIKRSSNEELKDEDVLDYLKESVDQVFKDINFDIRIGIRFDNYENENYTYHGRNLTKEEQYKYIINLTNLYHLLYIENPFTEEHSQELQKLCSNLKSNCLITLNSKINEYTKPINNGECNSVILKFLQLTDFTANVDYLQDKKINIIGECKKELVNLIIGLGINLIKVDNLEDDVDNIKAFDEITESIRNYLDKNIIVKEE